MDQVEFERAYLEHGSCIYRYCCFRSNSRGDAEDITAEVFLALLDSRRPPSHGYLLPWLYRVAQRKCVTHHRRSSHVEPMATVPERATSDPEPWLDDDVRRALSTLTPLQQLVVHLRTIEERPFEEVARLVGKRPGATKMLFYRAMQTLRLHLTDEGTL